MKEIANTASVQQQVREGWLRQRHATPGTAASTAAHHLASAATNIDSARTIIDIDLAGSAILTALAGRRALVGFVYAYGYTGGSSQTLIEFAEAVLTDKKDLLSGLADWLYRSSDLDDHTDLFEPVTRAEVEYALTITTEFIRTATDAIA